MKRSRSSTGAAKRPTRNPTSRDSRPAASAPRRRFAQHFLEPAWVSRLVQAIAPHSSDAILEIGPGRGALTRALVPHVRRLVGIEIDRDLAALLAASLPPHATVIASDFLETDVVSLVRDLGPGPARVAGNLPYNISSPILFKLIHSADEGRILSDATLMLQKEVAERLAARPDCRAYGALTVQVARVADVQQLFTLPPGAFRPAPTVSSAVVSLRFRRALESDAKTFERLVRGVFTRRRKTLANALVPLAMSLGRAASDILQIAQIDGRRRPEQLSPEEFARLSRAVL